MSIETLSRTFDLASRRASPPARQAQSIPNPFELPTSSTQNILGPLFQSTDESRDISRAKEQYKHLSGRVYSAFHVVARRIAAQPVMVGRILSHGQRSRSSLKSAYETGLLTRDQVPASLKTIDPNRVELLEDHKLHEVMEDPNELMTRHTIWMHTVLNILVTGKSHWLLLPDDDLAKILPLPTTWLTPNHSKRPFGHWDLLPPGSMADPKVIPRENIAYFYLPDPCDPFDALSPVRAQARTILTDEAIEVAQHVAFKNGIHPTIALIVGEALMSDGKSGTMELTQAQRKQILTWVRQEFQGVERYGMPFILDALFKDIKPISNKPAEMGFMESASLTKKGIFEGVGVPPVSAGQIENVNRAASAVADTHLASNVINPLIDLISQGITKRVVPLFSNGERLKAWIVPVRPHDPEMEVKLLSMALTHNVRVSDNEIRTRYLNLPPIEGGDEANQNLMFERVPVEMKGRQSRPAKPKSHKSRGEFWLKQHAKVETRLAKVVAPFLASQRDAVVSALMDKQRSHVKATPSEYLIAELFNPAQWDEALQEVMRDELLRAMGFGATTELNSREKQMEFITISADTSLSPEILAGFRDALDGMAEHGVFRAINETTRQKIVDELEAGMLNNEDVTSLARRIYSVMGDEQNRLRALRIATTEATSALNAGHWHAQQELAREGILSGRRWLTAGDLFVRGNDPDDVANHVVMDNVVVPIGRMFDLQGELAPWPGHPSLSAHQRVHCRCTAVGEETSVSMPAAASVRRNGRHKRLEHAR